MKNLLFTLIISALLYSCGTNPTGPTVTTPPVVGDSLLFKFDSIAVSFSYLNDSLLWFDTTSNQLKYRIKFNLQSTDTETQPPESTLVAITFFGGDSLIGISPRHFNSSIDTTFSFDSHVHYGRYLRFYVDARFISWFKISNFNLYRIH